ncbi:PIN domain-containing protein [Candidatus Daviesbacteria bacterium]|nr:PIN domain-containing protein [Candidatus Daviesbacteria bacterium]
MKIFIDTSVLIRFFTHDLPAKVEECEKIFEAIKEGKIKPYISNVVLMELIFVLTRQYKFKKDVVVKVLEDLLNIRNLTVIEKTNTKDALRFYKSSNIKYGDCLIATQVPQDVILVAYDKDFSKIPSLKSLTPAEVFNYDTVN